MPQKPHWPNDLHLKSHTYQFQDRYHEELVAERFAAMFDHAWGLSDIEWDVAGLATGQLALRHVRAILPDGTPVACSPSAPDTCPTKDVRDLGSRTSVLVYLSVAKSGPVTEPEGKSRRYVTERALVPDYANGGDPVELEWLRPNLELRLEGERLERYTTLPCARLVRSATGGVALDPTYIPPILNVSASPFLNAELRKAIDGLEARRVALRRAPTRDASDAPRQFLLSLLGGLVPRLRDAVDMRAHPHKAYLVLAETAGALAAFTPRGDASIPAFDYDRLEVTFGDLLRSVYAALGDLAAEQYRSVALRASDPTMLYAELREPGVFRREFFLVIAGDDVERLRAEVPRTVKVAAWADIVAVVNSHSKGIALEALQSGPSVLPNTPGAVYFRLSKTDAFEAVYKTSDMGIYHGGLAGIREIALYTVDPADL
jgi:type VI secretion system protein ImpJ